MRDAGVTLHKEKIEQPMKTQGVTPVFKNMKICVTGTLQSMKRADAQSIINQLQGEAVSGVTKTTNVLVVGDKTDSKSKVAKAQQNQIQIWDEDQFLEKVAESGLTF